MEGHMMRGKNSSQTVCVVQLGQAHMEAAMLVCAAARVVTENICEHVIFETNWAAESRPQEQDGAVFFYSACCVQR